MRVSYRPAGFTANSAVVKKVKSRVRTRVRFIGKVLNQRELLPMRTRGVRDKFRSLDERNESRLRLEAVMFGDRNELLLDVVPRAQLCANLFDLSEVRRFQRESVRRERLLRVVHQPLAELRVFLCSADDGTDHLVTHLSSPLRLI